MVTHWLGIEDAVVGTDSAAVMGKGAIVETTGASVTLKTPTAVVGTRCAVWSLQTSWSALGPMRRGGQ